MSRPGRAWVLLLAAVLLQTALGVVWPSGIWMPDLIAAAVIAAALENDRLTAVLIGLSAGAWQDISLGRLLGLHASLWAVLGYLTSALRQRIASDSWPITATIAMAVLLCERIAEWAVLTLIGVTAPPLFPLFGASVVTVPFVFLCRRLLRVRHRGLRRAVP